MSSWSTVRKQPYTKTGIARLKCIRCGGPASASWQICSDDNNHRPICTQCDIELNELVLHWMRHPEAKRLSQKYLAKRLVIQSFKPVSLKRRQSNRAS